MLVKWGSPWFNSENETWAETKLAVIRPLLIRCASGKSSFNAQELAATAFEIEEGSIVHNIEDTVEDDTDSEDDEGKMPI